MKGKEEVSTLKVYGKQVMYRMRDDKTEVKCQITWITENQKGRYAIG